MYSNAYSKKLCMTELKVERARHNHSHIFDATSGKVNSSFGYITKGSVILHSMGNSIEIPEGSLFYVPDGIRYHSVWTGSPEIEQYCIHIVSQKLDLEKEEYYPIQRIDALSTPETGELFRHIFDLFATGNRIDRIKAIGVYYGFYAQVLPLLRVAESVHYSAAVLSSIAYLEEHYAENFQIAQMADACHISESRLYHLFRKELKTTPIQLRNEIRIEKSAKALRNSNLQIDEIAYRHGFSSATYFYEIFKKYTGLTPTDYRNTAKT